jgi:plasmid stabilization system protein ParE
VRLLYTEQAIADLTRLRAFIAQWNPQAASRIAKDLVERIKTLRQFPEMGTPVSEAPDPKIIRDFVFDRYVVRYAVYAEALFILRIWHHREDRDAGN